MTQNNLELVKCKITMKKYGKKSAVHILSKHISKAFPVVGALTIFGCSFFGGETIFQGSKYSNCVRVIYTALFSFAMEYVSRYLHLFFWHSKYLWWIHGSHHNQKPSIGSKPVYEHGDKYVSHAIEFNDVFAIFFSGIAMTALYAGLGYPSTLAKDCSTGIGLGVTLYGFSYFVGHDIVAHERLGKQVANFCRKAYPYLDECATVHMRYHHKLLKRTDDHDPYGPPYGFWLGPFEVEYMKRRGQEYAPMPSLLKVIVWGSIAVFFVAIGNLLLPRKYMFANLA